MPQIAINTSQNVNILFTLASIGDRAVAFFIDTVIKTAYLIILYYIFFYRFNILSVLDLHDPWSVGAVFLILSFPTYIYTLALESLMEGQTIGKKIMKIKVIKIDGYQAGFGDFLIRWIFRLIDIDLTSGIVAVVSVLATKDSQRLGGIASGTAVISLKNNVRISNTILENLSQDYQPTFPQVIAFTDNDMRIIKDNFQKALRTGDGLIIRKLSEKIQSTLNIGHTLQMTDQQLIKTVIRDFNYYTGRDA